MQNKNAPQWQLQRHDFPSDFSFGTATSSYQIEGSSFGNCGQSHWDTFAAVPGNIANFDHGQTACNHYDLWESDLDLIAASGLQAYRFSTSWPRIFPEKGQLNAQGIDFYDRLTDGLLARNITPYLTLYHWDLPVWLADNGGWQNRDTTKYFAEFASFIASKLGDRIKHISPINEPWCVAWLSHYYGQHAPGLRDLRAAARAMHHVLLAHGRAVESLRTHSDIQVGFISNHEYIEAADDSEAAQKAATIYDALYNHWFVQAVYKQSYPQIILDGLEAYLPTQFEDDMSIIGQPVDWHGINYYTRKRIRQGQTNGYFDIEEIPGPLKKTTMDWEIYPQGLSYFLCWLHENFTQDIPIYITENGMSNHDSIINNSVVDHERIHYLDAHFIEAHKAIQRGVPLKGYFIWSLLDNFEWALGYDKRFGLVHVDFETLKRTPKLSMQQLQQFLGTKR